MEKIIGRTEEQELLLSLILQSLFWTKLVAQSFWAFLLKIFKISLTNRSVIAILELCYT